MTFLWKWLTVPVSNDTTQVKAVQLWEVRWTSRTGDYYADTRPEMEAFVSKAQADAFAVSINAALTLLRFSHHAKATVTKGVEV